MAGEQLIPVKEAQERLGVSKMTMTRLLREGRFTVTVNPLDRREKLLPVSEVDALAKFRPADKLSPQGERSARKRSDEHGE